MACSWARVRQECRRHKLWTNCYHVSYFTSSQWPIPPVVYVVYRLLMLIHFFTFLTYTVILAYTTGSGLWGTKTFIFLTIQSYIVLCAQSLLSAVLATTYYANNFPGCNLSSAREYEKYYHEPNVASADCHCYPAIEGSSGARSVCLARPISAIYKVFWVVYNVTANSALLVSIGYWGVIWPYIAEHSDTSGLSLLDFTVHTSTSIYVLIDLFLSATPIAFFHCWMTGVYGLYYGAFALVYWAAGGLGLGDNDFIYPMLDFSGDPGIAAGTIIGGVLVVVPALQVLLWALYRFRVWLYCSCYKNHVSITPDAGLTGVSNGYVDMKGDDEFVEIEMTTSEGL